VAPASKRGSGQPSSARPADGYAVALRLLALRPHSTAELRRKLRQRGCPAEEVEEALGRAAAHGYLDDDAYARALVSRRAAARGPALIAAELAAKGVSRSLVAVALEGLSREKQVAAATRLAGGLGVRDPNRAAARLQRRGFSREVIREALRLGLE
jgi:regulatory protein